MESLAGLRSIVTKKGKLGPDVEYDLVHIRDNEEVLIEDGKPSAPLAS